MWKTLQKLLGHGGERALVPLSQIPPGSLKKVDHELRQRMAEAVEHRCLSPCSLLYTPDRRPCFSIGDVLVEYGCLRHEKYIRSFLYSYYWPKEPSVTNLWMHLDSPYLQIQSDKYSKSGDRYIVYELEPRTLERKMVGLLVANKVCPWAVAELEEWADKLDHYEPEQTRIKLQAHCLKEPNLFKKYNVPYIYDVEVLATAAEVTALGVAELLLKTAITRAMELRHPLVQVIAKNAYVAKLCSRLGMQEEWSMSYSDFKDYRGKQLIYQRAPHSTITVFSRPFSQKEGGFPDFCDKFVLWKTYADLIQQGSFVCASARPCTRNRYRPPESKECDLTTPCAYTCYKNIFQNTYIAECPPACYKTPMTTQEREPKRP